MMVTTLPIISFSSIMDARRHISASMECGGSRSNWLAIAGSISWLIAGILSYGGDYPNAKPPMQRNCGAEDRGN